MSKALSYITTGLLMALPVTGFFVLAAFFTPQLFGHDGSYIVRSDSMEPELMEGDLIFVDQTEPSEIQLNDIVTYRKDHRNGSIKVTHRVVDIAQFNGTYYFRTKGDANAATDEGFTDESRIIGVVKEHYRSGGEAVDLFRSEVGWLLIIGPSLLVIIKEFTIINRELKWERLNRKEKIDNLIAKAEVEQ